MLQQKVKAKAIKVGERNGHLGTVERAKANRGDRTKAKARAKVGFSPGVGFGGSALPCGKEGTGAVVNWSRVCMAEA